MMLALSVSGDDSGVGILGTALSRGALFIEEAAQRKPVEPTHGEHV